MDYKEIEKMPEFESDVPENARAKLDDSDKWLADTISIINQREKWMCERVIIAYNTSLSNERWIKKYNNPISLIIGVISVSGLAFIGSLIEKWVNGK